MFHHTVVFFSLLLVFRNGSSKTIKKYVVPGKGVVIEQKDTVNKEIVIIANHSIAIYGSIAKESKYCSTANKSYVYEGEGTKGNVLGTLYTLDSSGPIIPNSTTVTISSKSLSAGGFLIRLYSDIKHMDYSFLWISNRQTTIKIKLEGVKKTPSAITILNTAYSEEESYLFLDKLKLKLGNSDESNLYWNAITSVDSDKTIQYYNDYDKTFTCRQEIPGKVNTFLVVAKGSANMTFIWWNTTYDKQVFVEYDHFFMRTADFGDLSIKKQSIANPSVPVVYPSLVHFEGVGDCNISYFLNGPQWSRANLTDANGLKLFGYNFLVEYIGAGDAEEDDVLPGQVEVTVISQLACNFMGDGIIYTCTHELYLAPDIDHAISACDAINGTLPIFHDYVDLNTLEMTKKTSFISPYDNDSNFKIWLGFKDGQWLDGSSFKAEGLNYSVFSDSPPALVYDRQTKQIMEWAGTAGVICQYTTDAKDLCYNPGSVGYQYYGTVPICLVSVGNHDFDTSSQDYCQKSLRGSPTLPEPQSQMENELIYSFAISAKTSAYLYPRDNPPERLPYAFLNYQGTEGQNCTTWRDSNLKMNYTNFAAGFNYSQCSDENLCLGVRLQSPNAAKWEFTSCDNRAVGICTVKTK